MEASKVSINPDFIRFEKMPRGKKTALRRQNVIDLIKSKPLGTPIVLSEFQAVTGHTTETSAWALIKTMIKKKKISRVAVEGRVNKFCYVVNDAKTVKPAAIAAPPHATPEKPAETAAPRARTTEMPAKNLTSYAREFAWESNSDSLRDFIKWMDGKELDLRRTMQGEVAA